MSDLAKSDRYKRHLNCRICKGSWSDYVYPSRPTKPFHVCAECASYVAHHEMQQRKLKAIAAIRGLH